MNPNLAAEVLIERQQWRSVHEGCSEPDCPRGEACLQELRNAREARLYANDVIAHNGYVSCTGCYFQAWVPTVHSRCERCSNAVRFAPPR